MSFHQRQKQWLDGEEHSPFVTVTAYFSVLARCALVPVLVAGEMGMFRGRWVSAPAWSVKLWLSAEVGGPSLSEHASSANQRRLTRSRVKERRLHPPCHLPRAHRRCAFCPCYHPSCGLCHRGVVEMFRWKPPGGAVFGSKVILPGFVSCLS